MPTQSDPVWVRVLNEQEEGHESRKRLYEQMEKLLERPVVAFFTSFRYPVAMQDRDVEMLQDVLQSIDLSRGLALVISSPGGDGLGAERIITTCRKYSGTAEYWAIVPGKAKSAATLVCFGASKILMGPTSELGSVDPQVPIPDENGVYRLVAAHHVITSYLDLFDRAVREKGNLEPYLQQLAHYDERVIKEFRSAIELSKDISIRTLATGMMKGDSKTDVEKRIKLFLTPEQTKTHGRPVYRDEARGCGLVIQDIARTDPLWNPTYELLVRMENYVWTRASKCIESRDHSFLVPPPKEDRQ